MGLSPFRYADTFITTVAFTQRKEVLYTPANERYYLDVVALLNPDGATTRTEIGVVSGGKDYPIFSNGNVAANVVLQYTNHQIVLDANSSLYFLWTAAGVDHKIGIYIQGWHEIIEYKES